MPHTHDNRSRAYLGGALSAGEREVFEEELSRDPRLRAALIELHRARQASPSWSGLPAEVRDRVLELGRQRAAPWPGVGARRALAAGLLIAGGLGLWWARSAPDLEPVPEVVREAPGSPAVGLLLLAPVRDARLRETVVDLTWTPVEGAGGYMLFLLDERGDIRATIQVAEPRYRLDLASEILGAPLERCWYVVAVLADGGRLASEARCWSVAVGDP